MASPGVDIGQLTESQQSSLQQYTSVTDQDLETAIPLLQRSQWNVQVAIAKFFDGETADPVAEAMASIPPPQSSTRRETLLNGSSSFSRASTSSDHEVDPAPRIVPQPENQVATQPPFLLSLFFTPFNILYRLLSGTLGFFGYLFPFLPRLLSNITSRNSRQGSMRNTIGRRPLNPRDTAARFTREFEEEYGSHSLLFYQNGYAQALDQAKKDLKFMLVVLLSPEHDDNSSFVRQTLLSSEVVDYIKDPINNIILWAGSVQDSEAYQVSNALHCTKFPFSALIVHTPEHSSTAMSVVTRIAGPTPPTAFVAKLQTAATQYSEALNRVRSTRAEQQASRNLREEQNSAYERSLAQDRERARQRREAEAVREREEREAKEKIEAEERRAETVLRWKRWRASSLKPEPGPDVQDSARISIRMPSGDRLIRKFAPETQLEDLYAFIECHEILEAATIDEKVEEPRDYKHEYGFRLVSPMPRTVYELESNKTVKDSIGRSGNLIVEPTLEVDEEDEEEDNK
ncbi:MAG: hypothetical protein M1827_003408 [Pycnora praestabilis]|nr:MAG: hypothetical protein M1827_003408 [Pycnora praestabilis]